MDCKGQAISLQTETQQTEREETTTTSCCPSTPTARSPLKRKDTRLQKPFEQQTQPITNPIILARRRNFLLLTHILERMIHNRKGFNQTGTEAVKTQSESSAKRSLVAAHTEANEHQCHGKSFSTFRDRVGMQQEGRKVSSSCSTLVQQTDNAELESTFHRWCSNSIVEGLARLRTPTRELQLQGTYSQKNGRKFKQNMTIENPSMGVSILARFIQRTLGASGLRLPGLERLLHNDLQDFQGYGPTGCSICCKINNQDTATFKAVNIVLTIKRMATVDEQWDVELYGEVYELQAYDEKAHASLEQLHKYASQDCLQVLKHHFGLGLGEDTPTFDRNGDSAVSLSCIQKNDRQVTDPPAKEENGDAFYVSVMVNDSECIVVDLQQRCTVLSLKKKLFELEGIPIETQHIYFDSERLEDHHLLSYYGITNDQPGQLFGSDLMLCTR